MLYDVTQNSSKWGARELKAGNLSYPARFKRQTNFKLWAERRHPAVGLDELDCKASQIAAQRGF